LKKTAFVLVISASTMLMVLPLLRGVNHPGNNEVRIEKTLRADGVTVPLPLAPPSFVV